jgi:hypothetical protein
MARRTASRTGKRRYGQNVVLMWIGSSAVKKTDPSWKRLHAGLTAATT